MLYSTFTGKTVELPLDGRAYERHLKKLIASSTAKKKSPRLLPERSGRGFHKIVQITR